MTFLKENAILLVFAQEKNSIRIISNSDVTIDWLRATPTEQVISPPWEALQDKSDSRAHLLMRWYLGTRRSEQLKTFVLIIQLPILILWINVIKSPRKNYRQSEGHLTPNQKVISHIGNLATKYRTFHKTRKLVNSLRFQVYFSFQMDFPYGYGIM